MGLRRDNKIKWVQIKLSKASAQDRAILEYKERFYPRLSMSAFFLELAQKAEREERSRGSEA